MNALNRLIGVLLFLATLLGASLLFLFVFLPDFVTSIRVPPGMERSWGNVVTAGGWASAHLQHRTLDEIAICAVGLLVAVVLSLLLLYLEFQSLGEAPGLLIHRTKEGSTVLESSALRDLIRWVGEDTIGVDTMPIVAVNRQGKKLMVTGMVLWSTYANAKEIAPILQDRIRHEVQRATGISAQVRLRSRFQKATARKKVK